jgi:hypothetical protein
MTVEPIDPLRGLCRQGLFRPVPIDPTGVHGPTRAQARSARWRRSSHGLYVLQTEYADPVDQRILEAAAVLPPFGGVTGWAALHWSGAEYFDGTAAGGRLLDVPLAVSDHDIRSQPGIRVTAERIGPRHLITVDGMPLTHHARSVCFEMRYARDLTTAIRILDMAASADLVSLREVWAHAVVELSGWTGVDRVRKALPWADENSWSPTETEMRLLWTAHLRLPRPLCNHPVFDRDGRFVATPDLLDIEAGMVGEYDGELHLDRRRRSRDIAREAAFRRVGLEYVTMTAADRRDPGPYLRRVREARGRALFLPAERRAWTVEPPAWWTPTVTVEQRRALDEGQRARYLRRRTA